MSRLAQDAFKKELAKQYVDPSPEMAGHMDTYFRYMFAGAVPEVVEQLGVQEADHVLDVGCGGGHMLHELLRQFPNATASGIDRSAEMVALAKKRNKRDVVTGRATFTVADAIKAMPFGSNTFDIVYSYALAEFLEDPEPLVRNMHRVLKPGGLLAVCIRNQEETWDMPLFDSVSRKYGVTPMTNEDLGKIVQDLELGEYMKATNPWYSCHLKIKAAPGGGQ